MYASDDKQMPVPDPAIVLDLIDAFRRSKTMFAAVSLGVFEILSAKGPLPLSSLANDLYANADALERLLDACVGLQLLTRADTLYSNTPLATAYLCKASPNAITGYIGYSNVVLWKLWGNLEDATREGTNRWKQTYGWDGPIFDHFFRDQASKREFLMGMHGFGVISSPHVVAAFDLTRFRRLVDLGGATGHLAIAACQRYSELEAVVFDLAAVGEIAREIVGTSPVADRVSIESGDFFNDPLPDADLFAVGRILHDWSEAKIVVLLQRIYHRLPSGGALLIAEKLLDDDKMGPRSAQMQSLNMLVCTEGKERTLAEYEKLLKDVGFADVVGRRTKSPLDAMLALKE
jgi:acetylserotonin N-methyltransferase